MPKTNAELVVDIVTVMSNRIPIPETSIDSIVKATSENLVFLLMNKKKY